jgi:hypothetical protein
MIRRILSILIVGFILAIGISYAEQIVRIAPLTISIKSTNTTVNATATALPATALVGRENIAIYNNDAATTTVYIGGSDVTTTNGFPLTTSCPAISLDLDNTVIMYGIVASGTADVRTLEAK